MVGKSVSEKVAEKKAAAAAQSVVTDAGDFKVVGSAHGGDDDMFIAFSKTEPGFTVIGKLLKFVDGKFGENAVLEVDGSEKQFVISAGLKDIKDVPLGATVRIIHLGMAPTKSGKQFRKYEIAFKE